MKMRRLPDWLKVKLPSGAGYLKLKSLVKGSTNTVCAEAKCPNIAECWSHGTATFMILGDICTRACRYCNVKKGWPNKIVDMDEPARIARIVKSLGLKYAVITSVDRDDLDDGGASVFAETVRKIHRLAKCKVEILTPDYTGDNLNKVLSSRPEVFSHNIETVRSIFAKVKPKGNYNLSLSVLKDAKLLNPSQKTKTALMVGFGETKKEIIETMQDLRSCSVDFLVIGQYLQPTLKHAKVERYYTPEEFGELGDIGRQMGFSNVESGSLVRSSYRAEKLIEKL